MHAVSGENAPENLSKADRNVLKQEVIDAGLVFSALCGDFGFGFGNKEKNPELIEKSKRIVELAKELGTDIITTHIGVVPADKKTKGIRLCRRRALNFHILRTVWRHILLLKRGLKHQMY